MKQLPSFLRSGLTCYLFIYLVADRQDTGHRYCTVLAYGRTLEAAERIAINHVHQQGLRIVRADTATAAPWLDPVSDAGYLADLARFGSAMRVSEVPASGAPATAA